MEDGYDLVVWIGVLEDSGLIASRVGDCPLYICAAPQFVEDHGMPASLADIPAPPAVIYSLAAAASSWSCRDADGVQTTVGLSPALYAKSAGMMLDACIEGVGVAILPYFNCAEALATGHLVRLLPDYDTAPDLGVYVVYPDKRFVP